MKKVNVLLLICIISIILFIFVCSCKKIFNFNIEKFEGTDVNNENNTNDMTNNVLTNNDNNNDNTNDMTNNILTNNDNDNDNDNSDNNDNISDNSDDNDDNDDIIHEETDMYSFINGSCVLDTNGIYNSEEECNSMNKIIHEECKEDNNKPDTSTHTLSKCTPIVNVSYYTNNYSNKVVEKNTKIRPNNYEPIQSTYVSPNINNEYRSKTSYNNGDYIKKILNQKSDYCPIIMGNSNGYGEFKSRDN